MVTNIQGDLPEYQGVLRNIGHDDDQLIESKPVETDHQSVLFFGQVNDGAESPEGRGYIVCWYLG